MTSKRWRMKWTACLRIWRPSLSLALVLVELFKTSTRRLPNSQVRTKPGIWGCWLSCSPCFHKGVTLSAFLFYRVPFQGFTPSYGSCSFCLNYPRDWTNVWSCRPMLRRWSPTAMPDVCCSSTATCPPSREFRMTATPSWTSWHRNSDRSSGLSAFRLEKLFWCIVAATQWHWRIYFIILKMADQNEI